MIISLIDNYRETVQIDRIKVLDNDGNEYITIELKEIKKEVENYYKKAFKRRKANFNNLNQS